MTALLFGCSKQPELQPTPEADKITVTSGSSLTFQSEESIGTITINSNVAWKATATESWVELSPTSGTSGTASISVKAKANESTDERNASVTITGGKASATVKVTQKQKDAFIVSEGKVEIGGGGGEFVVVVKSNVDVQHSIDVDWIKLVSTKAMATKTMTFAVEASEEKEMREGTITFYSGELKETITIIQDKNISLSVNPSSFTITYEEQVIDLVIRTNIDYDIVIDSNCSEWISKQCTLPTVGSENDRTLSSKFLYNTR